MIASAPPSSSIFSLSCLPCSNSSMIISCVSIDAAAAMMVTCLCMLSLISLNFWESRPDMSIWVMKYWFLSLLRNATPSSIS